MMTGTQEHGACRFGGIRGPSVAGVVISHPDRVLFPATPATKLDLARYYEAVAQWMLPDVVDRPLTLVHCQKGVPPRGARKGVDCVFMKHAKLWGPSALRRVRIREKTKVGEYLIADVGRGGWQVVRDLLRALELESFVKTTGGKGHFAQALVRRSPGRRTERFAIAGRDEKVLIDYLRNNRTNTSVAA